MAVRRAALLPLLLLLVIPERAPATDLDHRRSHGQPYPKEDLLDVDYIRDDDNPLDQYEAERDTTTTIATTTEPFDCKAGLAKWRFGWSDDKKAFCCKVHKLGCSTKDAATTAAPTTAAPITAAETTAVATTDAVKTTAEVFDCKAGLAKWRLGWSDAKKTFCCKAHKLGCATKDEGTTAAASVAAATTTEEFDCSAGLAKWRLGWSDAKKTFCCKAHKLGCATNDEGTTAAAIAGATTTTEEFDCSAGLAKWQLGWSGSKKKFCCKSQGLGCSNTTTDHKTKISNCTTVKPPRPAWFAATAPEGSRCLFGLDDRDENGHCIIDNPEMNGVNGWCWTRADKSEWGACSKQCPLFGQFKKLQNRVRKAEDEVAKLRKLLTEARGSSNTSLVEEATDQELALLDAATESTPHDAGRHAPLEKPSLRGFLRRFTEDMHEPQVQIGTAFLQIEGMRGDTWETCVET